MNNPVANKLWKRVVLDKAMNRCELGVEHECDGYAHDSHHLVPRSFMRYKYDPDNGFACCRIGHQWIETHPAEFVKWLEDNREDLVEFILSAHICYHSPSQEEIDEQIGQLKCYLGLDPHGDTESHTPVSD